MRIMKKILPAIFWLLIFGLLFLPIGLIYQISEAEMREYEAPETPILQETAFGEPKRAARVDIYESVTLSGHFVSESWADMELSYKRPDLIRWSIAQSDQIFEGQSIGTYQGKEITSNLTGIVMEINSYSAENAYIRVRLLEPVLWECNLTQKQLAAVRKHDGLSLEDGTPVTLIYTSLTRNPDDTTTVQFSIDSDTYQYGQELADTALYTGVCYPQTLVLPEECLYQKPNSGDDTWYARKVSEDGYFISEVQVQANGNYDGMVRVSGVSEGECFDSGYKAILEASQ